jgi:hypothetical protein
MRNSFPSWSIACGLGLLVTLPATAQNAPSPDPYATECGGCHVAFPAKFLPRSDWQLVLGDLERHYGVDASLDADTLEAVARHLGVSGQRPPGKAVATLPRITTQPWFRREHRELPAAAFRSRDVKGAADCSACHLRAERGDFEEESLRVPGHRHD